MPNTNPYLLATAATPGPVTVLFLHHFGGSQRTWSEVISRLKLLEPMLECHAFDQRGFGDSSLDATGCTIDDYVGDVAKMLAERKINRCILVGHSMGGKIALAVAARQLSAVAGLLLIAPSPPTPEPMSDEDREELRLAQSHPSVASEVVSKTITTKLPDAIAERTVEDIGRSSAAAWTWWLDAGSRQDISAFMANVHVSVTVLAGGRDPGMTPSLLKREVVARISGSQLIVIPDSGHLMPLDAPAAISNYVRGIVKTLASNATQDAPTNYPLGTVRQLLGSDLVTDATRKVLTQRLEAGQFSAPAFFETHTFDVLAAVCSRLVPQPLADGALSIAREIDTRLATGDGNGWRYEVLPVDGAAYKQGLQGIEDLSIATHGCGFCSLCPDEQNTILSSIQRGLVAGGIWLKLSSKLFFEELLAEASEIYFSSPISQERIGYVGMADRQGWSKIALNQLDPHEPRAAESLRG